LNRLSSLGRSTSASPCAYRPRQRCERALLTGAQLSQAGHWPRALAAYWQTLELSHAWLVTRSNMAWILSTAPEASVRDGALALKLAQPLAELKTRDRPLLGISA
jgi:hypothetical protein